jgi:hypothetical protein
MPIFQDLIPEVIPSQKCHMNIGSILSGYGADNTHLRLHFNMEITLQAFTSDENKFSRQH